MDFSYLLFSTVRLTEVLTFFETSMSQIFILCFCFPSVHWGLKYISKKKNQNTVTLESGVPLCYRTDIRNFPSNMSAAMCVQAWHQHCTVQRDIGGTSLCTLVREPKRETHWQSTKEGSAQPNSLSEACTHGWNLCRISLLRLIWLLFIWVL